MFSLYNFNSSFDFSDTLFMMFLRSITTPFQLSRRFISSSSVLKQGINNHQPNNLEKRFLVWTGKYKTVEEVPNFVSRDVMERTRNKVRIRIANIMMALTVIGCGIMVYSGKEAAKRGESVTKQNLDWHKQYNEKYSNKEAKE
uniref:Putative conserved plasma membrane protein n=3 Tax=Haematobia irritans TaxID=7368 RepID=A0A1L8E9R4_HAEIR